MVQTFPDLIKIQTLCPHFAYIKDLTTLCSPSVLVIFTSANEIHAFNFLKVCIIMTKSEESWKLFKTESRRVCCQILVSEVWTQNLYFNQKEPFFLACVMFVTVITSLVVGIIWLKHYQRSLGIYTNVPAQVRYFITYCKLRNLLLLLLNNVHEWEINYCDFRKWCIHILY